MGLTGDQAVGNSVRGKFRTEIGVEGACRFMAVRIGKANVLCIDLE